MKLFLIVCFFVGVVLVANAEAATVEDHMKMAEVMAKACQAQENATDADINEFLRQQKPSTLSAKCLHACMLESIGLVVDGKLSVTNSLQLVSIAADGNNELMATVKAIAEECEAVTDTNRCEMAFKIITCTEEGMKKRQFDPRKMTPKRKP